MYILTDNLNKGGEMTIQRNYNNKLNEKKIFCVTDLFFILVDINKYKNY